MIFRLHANQAVFEQILKLLAKSQWIWDRPSIRRIIERLTRPLLRGIAETAKLQFDMVLPRLARRHLRDRHASLVMNEGTGRSPVAYFHGCAANYFDDGVGDAVIAVLRKHGVTPDLPLQRCSGTPIDTYGHRRLAKEGARINLKSLAGYETVVTGCASCTLMLKDYPQLFAGEPEQAAAEAMAKRVQHISEFVARSTVSPPASARQGGNKKVTYHSSCHLLAAGVTKEPRKVLSTLPGVKFVEMQDADRCAGGAGTYLVKDYDTSQKIFDRKRRAIDQSGAEVVATSCPACMIQLKNGLRGKADVKHIAQVLQEAYQAADGKDIPTR
jgi:Fe-S oxidoreductase